MFSQSIHRRPRQIKFVRAAFGSTWLFLPPRICPAAGHMSMTVYTLYIAKNMTFANVIRATTPQSQRYKVKIRPSAALPSARRSDTGQPEPTREACAPYVNLILYGRRSLGPPGPGIHHLPAARHCVTFGTSFRHRREHFRA